MHWYDAHNHLQDDRFNPCQPQVIEEARQVGVLQMVVNGSCESDWPRVAELAAKFPDRIIPAFGYHPWYVRERTPDWQSRLLHFLDTVPNAVIGEIGVDKWILQQPPDRLAEFAPGMIGAPAPLEEQQEVFVTQFQIAAKRNLSASLHCLDAFGLLDQMLRIHPAPRCGFLIHSYGGPREMVSTFAKHGAYFSFPGYFAHERKRRQREAFLAVPLDRLLIETDAPDQVPPPELLSFSVGSPEGRRWNHPANLPAIGGYLATLRGLTPEQLSEVVEENFCRLFTRRCPDKFDPQ